MSMLELGYGLGQAREISPFFIFQFPFSILTSSKTKPAWTSDAGGSGVEFQ